MTFHTSVREHQRLLEVAREYRQRGYEVVLEPEPHQLPEFLAPFRVDLVARNAEENVVVEIRTQESLTQVPELDALAQAIHGQGRWRFELVVTNPKDRTSLQFKDATSLNQHDIGSRLREARQLSDQEHGEAAFLLAWSATEALLRHIAEEEAIPGVQNNPNQLVKALYTYGALAHNQYQALQEGLQARNMVVHGYKEQRSLVSIFEQILEITEQLAKQYLAL